VFELDQEWQPSKTTITLSASAIKRYTPYEELAQSEGEDFVKEHWDDRARENPDYLSKRDTYASASHVLSDVDKWHRAARSKEIRQGDEWKNVQEALQKKIVYYREQQLDQALLEDDWDAASELATDISRSATDKETQEGLARRLAHYMVKVLAA